MERRCWTLDPTKWKKKKKNHRQGDSVAVTSGPRPDGPRLGPWALSMILGGSALAGYASRVIHAAFTPPPPSDSPGRSVRQDHQDLAHEHADQSDRVLS